MDSLRKLLRFFDIRRLTGGQTLFLGFALIALAGMIVLMFPFSNNYGVWTNPVDALFTSISAVCVTGLIVVPTGTYWNLFGQLVILLLIQIGGLGFMTFMTMAFIATGRTITIHDRLIIQSSINSDHIAGIVVFVKKILKYALIIELIGAVLLAFVFLPQLGLVKGLYFSVWHAVSMYCNAGFDLMAELGENSFCSYINNSWVTLSVCFLIIIGGLGFSVYINILDYLKGERLAVHTKVVLWTTAFLLIGGTILFLCFEWNNPLTIADLPWYGKINASFFQATTPRTAGANMVDQAALTPASQILTDIFMFIGASPGSTGGGIKTTTVFVLLITVWSVLMGKEHVNCFKRSIPFETIKRALAIFTIGIIVISFMFFCLMLFQPLMDPKDLLFELLSAYGTVGLSTGITSSLSYFSKIILIICMFVGRVGPLTIAYLITNTEQRSRQNTGHYELPKTSILLG